MKPSFLAASTVAAITATFVIVPVPARAQEMSLKEYQSLLGRYQKISDRSKPVPQETAEVAKQLLAVETVTLPNGKTVSVDLKQDADVLLKTKPTPKTDKPKNNKAKDAKAASKTTGAFNEVAEARADALAALVVWDGEAPDASQAQTQAAAILAQPEFQIAPEKESTTPGWMRRIGEWFGRQFRAFGRWISYWWRRLFPAPKAVSPGGFAGFAEFVRFLLYFVVAVGTLIGVYFLAVYVSGKKRGTVKKGRGGTTGLDLDLDEFPDPLGYAREVAARGDYREAVRLVYIASLRRLAGSGLVVLQGKPHELGVSTRLALPKSRRLRPFTSQHKAF